MDKVIYLTRHAQAYHNVAEDWSIPDAELTPLGREQSAALRKDTEGSFQREVDLIVSSPVSLGSSRLCSVLGQGQTTPARVLGSAVYVAEYMRLTRFTPSQLRRPMQTALIGYAPLVERLNQRGKPMVLLPELQEVNDLPCDTGSARKDLESNPEFASLDFSPLEPFPLPAHWSSAPSWTSKQGLFDPDNCQERARWVRRWLRDETKEEEKKVVVVAHGDILRVIADGYRSDKPWANAEIRAFRFQSADDHEAVLVAATDIDPTANTAESGASDATVAKEGSDEPTSSDLKN